MLTDHRSRTASAEERTPRLRRWLTRTGIAAAAALLLTAVGAPTVALGDAIVYQVGPANDQGVYSVSPDPVRMATTEGFRIDAPSPFWNRSDAGWFRYLSVELRWISNGTSQPIASEHLHSTTDPDGGWIAIFVPEGVDNPAHRN